MSAAPHIVKAAARGLGRGMPANDEKAARLAAQLRANLRRRKEQARGTPPAASTKPDDAGPRDA